MPSVTAIIPAAGKSVRMAGVSKQYAQLHGLPVLAHTLRIFQAMPEIERVVLVVREKDIDYCRDKIVAALGFDKVKAVLAGGAHRQESVRRGLLAADSKWVIVHDGARPILKRELAGAVLQAAMETGAATAAVPVVDTIKVVAGGMVQKTLLREQLWAVQTPQAFDRELLWQAHQKAQQEGFLATDDASLIERYGHPVRVVEGDRHNLKITHRQDLAVAEFLLGNSRPRVRTGIGYDIHRTGPGTDLMLGGVRLPAGFSLQGHSDADVLLHAIMDALLGAAGLGDIGEHFPDHDPELRGISSCVLLARTVLLLRSRGGHRCRLMPR